MATIYNSSLTKELVDVVKLQQQRDFVPNQIADKVVPVIDINPKHARISNIVRSVISSAASSTLYTVPILKDFYLTGCCLGVTKDVTNTSISSSIIIFIDGVAVRCIAIPGITLTAQDQTLSISFPFPIKCDRGTTITLNQTAGGVILSSGQIIGYEIENINA